MEQAGEQPRGAWQRLGLVLGPLVFFAVGLLPSELHRIPGLGDRPAWAAAVAAWMAIWWFTEALPMAVTACLPLLLFPLCGVFGLGPWGDARRAVEPFVDAYIFLFLGGMALGAAMEQWNLHRRIALHIMRALGTEPSRLLLGVLVATAAISLWISNTATAVMMVPIALALLKQLEEQRGGRRLTSYGAAVMLAVAYGSNVGGMGSKIGTATNSIFAGFLSEKLSQEMGFLKFMALGLPFVALFLPVIWRVLWRLGRRDAPVASGTGALLDEELRKLGPWSRGEKTVAALFGGAAALWISGDLLRPTLARLAAAWLDGFRLQGKHYEATVSMAALALLLLSRSVSGESLRRVPWGTLLLLGGSFAMAAGIEGSGLSGYLGMQLRGVAELPLFAQLGLTAFSTVALSAVASNTATVNLMLNVLPRNLAVLGTCCLAASCDFALPAGTPPNAIVFGSGRIRLPVMMTTGLLLDVAAAAALALYGYLYLERLL